MGFGTHLNIQHYNYILSTYELTSFLDIKSFLLPNMPIANPALLMLLEPHKLTY